MSSSVWPLDDPRGKEAVSGSKARFLAIAKSYGLPVLDGVVVGGAAAEQAVRQGVLALPERGSGGARRTVAGLPLSSDVLADLRHAVGPLGDRLIVRSSGDVESSHAWSGAFSTFGDVRPEDVEVAVRGCWASMFGVDTLERCEQAGVQPDQLYLAVLVQPCLIPELAGVARSVAGGVVQIDVVHGSAGPMMAGRAKGGVVQVDSSGRVLGGEDLPGAVAAQVAELHRKVVDLLGHDVIEWMYVDGEIVLAQSMPSESRPIRGSGFAVDTDEFSDPRLDKIADLVLGFPGELSERLVLPWLLALRDQDLSDVLSADSTPLTDPAEVEDLGSSLVRAAWSGVDPADPAGAAAEFLQHLRSGNISRALPSLDRLGRPSVPEGRRLLSVLRSAGVDAHRAGRLRQADDVFAGDAVAGTSTTARAWVGPRRWEPFLASLISTRGTPFRAEAAAPGIGAGIARVVLDPYAPPPRRGQPAVVVAPLPLRPIAPLLWDAAGLVVGGGSPAAHLFEVARSLGVPAVIQRDLEPEHFAEALVCVDGDVGQIAWHRTGGTG